MCPRASLSRVPLVCCARVLFVFSLPPLSLVNVIATWTVVLCSQVNNYKMKTDHFKCFFNFMNLLNPVGFIVVCNARNIKLINEYACVYLWMCVCSNQVLKFYIWLLSIYISNANTTG